MSNDVVLQASGVSKRFCPNLRRSLRYGISDMFRELAPFRDVPRDLRPGEFWALDDLSFQLRRGEALAIMGKNGAGKSTLLKILYGLIKPDRGIVKIDGRVEAIIELGTGFNNSLTGRENVEVAGGIFGVKGSRISALVDEVMDFAELGEFADAPIQSYSSGMKARLGFALASHLKPEILLVDEALAVGDHDFQRKAVRKIKSYLDDGGSLIFVSHHFYQIQTICSRGILIDKGRKMFEGTATAALDAMYKTPKPARDVASPETPLSQSPVRIRGFSVYPLVDKALTSGTSVRIVMQYEASARVRGIWGFHIWTQDRWVCLAGEDSGVPEIFEAGTGEVSCSVFNLPLSPGTYVLTGAIIDPDTLIPYDLYGQATAPAAFEVLGSDDDINRRANGQVIQLDVRWGDRQPYPSGENLGLSA
jgi:ABC-type polysaccharide/polyol phosphate transport system ATPase subunit